MKLGEKSTPINSLDLNISPGPLVNDTTINPFNKKSVLHETTEVIVRFNEADPLGIVWHGHYIRYFEDGREAFGRKFGVAYLDFYAQGYAVPIVSVQCDYKKPLRYGERVLVECYYVETPAAKLKFTYKIFEADTKELVATGSSVQVFVESKNFQLQLTIPPFFQEWKKKMKLTE